MEMETVNLFVNIVGSTLIVMGFLEMWQNRRRRWGEHRNRKNKYEG